MDEDESRLNLDIELDNDPMRDDDARKAALSVLTAYLQEMDGLEGKRKPLLSVACTAWAEPVLDVLLDQPDLDPDIAMEVVGEVVRRVHAMANTATALALFSFQIGQLEPEMDGPPWDAVLRDVSRWVWTDPDEEAPPS